MSDTQDMTPEGNAELDVNGAASAILGLMDDDSGSEQEQPENRAESNDSEAESDEYEESDESEVEQEDDGEEEEQPRYRVKAAGEEREVTLDELIKSYQLGTDYTKKSQAVAEERKAIEAERQRIEEAKYLRDQYAQRLQVIEQILNQPQQEEDLSYLKEHDPIGYAVKVAEMSQREKQLAQVREERMKIAQMQEQEQQQYLAQRVQAEAEKLKEVLPAYADPKQGEALRREIREFAARSGYTDEELSAVYDSRHVLTLWKAAQYDKLQSAKPGITKRVAEAPKIIKSGVSRPADAQGDEVKKLKQRAKNSGRVADAAAVFERFL